MPAEYTDAGIIRKRLMLKFETVEEATQISALQTLLKLYKFDFVVDWHQ